MSTVLVEERLLDRGSYPTPPTLHTELTKYFKCISYLNSALSPYAIVFKPQPTKLLNQSVNLAAIQMLINLLSELTAGTADIRDVLISILTAIIPLLLSHYV